jgi:glycosyltransferase involved in cell wall biosynthesis
MTTKPILTIGLPVFNGADTLQRAVSSILSQSFQQWELVILDDGSSDSTLALCSMFKDPRIKVVTENHQRGLAARLNQIIAGTKSEYFARMDADDVAFPKRFELQLSALNADPALSVVGCSALMFRQRGVAVGVMRSPTSHREIGGRPAGGFSLFHPTWMGRSVWFRSHLYDPTFKRAQDYELLLRTLPTSRFGAVPEVLLGYHYERQSLRKRLLTRRYAAKALVKNRRLYGGLGWLALALGRVGLKALLDTGIYASGSVELFERMKLQQPTADLVSEWETVWSATGEASCAG